MFILCKIKKKIPLDLNKKRLDHQTETIMMLVLCERAAPTDLLLIILVGGRKVGKQLRRVPELNFYLDDSLDHLDAVERALNS